MSDAINITAKVSVDTYSEIQEERRAVGSVAKSVVINEGADGSFNRNEQGSGYLRKKINSSAGTVIGGDELETKLFWDVN